MSIIQGFGGLDNETLVTDTDLDPWKHQMKDMDTRLTSDNADYNAESDSNYFDFSSNVLSLGASQGDETTKNGSGGRSELRQEDNWAFGGQDNALATTYSVPQDSYDMPITIGQIMQQDGDDHVPMVRIEHNKGKLEAVIRTEPGLGDSADKRISLNDGDPIAAGEQFQVGMEVDENGQLKFSLFDESGKSLLVPEAEKPVDMSAWSGEDAYFKSGVYHSGNKNNDSDHATVNLHDIDIL